MTDKEVAKFMYTCWRLGISKKPEYIKELWLDPHWMLRNEICEVLHELSGEAAAAAQREP